MNEIENRKTIRMQICSLDWAIQAWLFKIHKIDIYLKRLIRNKKKIEVNHQCEKWKKQNIINSKGI